MILCRKIYFNFNFSMLKCSDQIFIQKSYNFHSFIKIKSKLTCYLFLKYFVLCERKCHTHWFSHPYIFATINVIDLIYYKLWLLLTEIILGLDIKGLHHQFAKIYGLAKLSYSTQGRNFTLTELFVILLIGIVTLHYRWIYSV